MAVLVAVAVLIAVPSGQLYLRFKFRINCQASHRDIHALHVHWTEQDAHAIHRIWLVALYVCCSSPLLLFTEDTRV